MHTEHVIPSWSQNISNTDGIQNENGKKKQTNKQTRNKQTKNKQTNKTEPNAPDTWTTFDFFPTKVST